jgi:protein N-terminal methyltransferase
VEQDPAFLKTAETEYLKEFGDRVQRYICQGLQDFVPEAGRYEAIWAQWCLGHLTDCGFFALLAIDTTLTGSLVLTPSSQPADLVAFFVRCKRGIKPNGMLFVKENITRKFTIDMDESDSSVTRSDEILKGIFEKAGLRILKEKEQDGFPADIFPVKMWVHLSHFS